MKNFFIMFRINLKCEQCDLRYSTKLGGYKNLHTVKLPTILIGGNICIK